MGKVLVRVIIEMDLLHIKKFGEIKFGPQGHVMEVNNWGTITGGTAIVIKREVVTEFALQDN